MSDREGQDADEGALDRVQSIHHRWGSDGFGRQPGRPRESFIGLSAPAVHYLGARSPEADRRRKLGVTDQLLTDIEELRLEPGNFLSAFLRDRIAAAEAEIIGTRRHSRIKNLRGAYELVLSLQGPLMAANPKNVRNPRARSRPSGKPNTTDHV